jgi:hypothetical protein
MLVEEIGDDVQRDVVGPEMDYEQTKDERDDRACKAFGEGRSQ